jgi:hypothetical protein
MRNEKRRMSERVYSEHLRWTKDGLRIHEDIYNGRDDSTDWATEAEAHRSRPRSRAGSEGGGGRRTTRSGTSHRASRTAWRTGGGPTRELAQRAEQGHPPGPRARRAIGTRLTACVRSYIIRSGSHRT